jgi:hypothetical protein
MAARLLRPERALAPRAGRGHYHRFVGAEQQQRREIDGMRIDIVDPLVASGRKPSGPKRPTSTPATR